MRKMTVLVLLSVLPSFAHTMEHSQEIDPSVLNSIRNNMRTMHEDNVRTMHDIKMTIKSSDGKKIAILDWNGDISLWDGVTGKLMDIVADNQFNVLSLGFNPEGTKVIVTTSKGLKEYTAIEDTPPDLLHFIEDGTKIAFLYADGTILVADKKGKMLIDRTIAENPKDVIGLEFNKNGTGVIATTSKGSEEFSYVG